MDEFVTIFMCGDVMTGRGIDQVMPHPCDPKLYEFFMKSAKGYVELAEQRNGEIQKPINYSYIWGDVLDEMKRMDTDIEDLPEIRNLEQNKERLLEYFEYYDIVTLVDRIDALLEQEELCTTSR